MSTVFLHVGQCGNQLGKAFWGEASKPQWSKGYNTVHNSDRKASELVSRAQLKSGVSKTPPAAPKAKAPPSRYIPFSLVDGSLPCVLIDTEPKVIRHCLDKRRESAILAQRVCGERCVWDKAGRGNNWAYGYHGISGRRAGGCGHNFLESVLDSVRKVVERCDRFSGFVLFHSIAGGTGSGLGSALVEHLRTHYPLSYIITVTIAPFMRGETPLQHLNSLLCLSWLQSYSDAVLLFGNDSVLEQTQKSVTRAGEARGRVLEGGEGKPVGVEDMNRHVCSVLCNTFMPVWQNKQRSPKLSYQEPWELIRSLCPDPRSKFISPTHVHCTSPSKTWSQVTSLLLQQGLNSPWRKAASTDTRTSSLAFIARSSPSNMDTFLQGMNPLEAKLKRSYKTVEWNPFPVDYWLSYEPSMGQTKLATVLANSSVVLDYVGAVREQAGAMFEVGAYLHWYERYGCERQTFEQAFESVEGIIETYREI